MTTVKILKSCFPMFYMSILMDSLCTSVLQGLFQSCNILSTFTKVTEVFCGFVNNDYGILSFQNKKVVLDLSRPCENLFL